MHQKDSFNPYNNKNITEGNHPSTLFICENCDAFTCGQMIAITKHGAIIHLSCGI